MNQLKPAINRIIKNYTRDKIFFKDPSVRINNQIITNRISSIGYNRRELLKPIVKKNSWKELVESKKIRPNFIFKKN